MTVSHVAVLPSIHEPYTRLCVASMSDRLRSGLHVVDNTVRNRGVAAAWNDGARRVLNESIDWLVVVSAAVRFGPPGGDDLLDALDAAAGDEWAIEAAESAFPLGNHREGIGWHLIAFPRTTLQRVGLFDENFFAYFEDNDYGCRVLLASGTTSPLWPKVPVVAWIASVGHGVKLGHAVTDPHAARAYYVSKWGGPPSRETFTTPFGHPALPLDFWDARQPGT